MQWNAQDASHTPLVQKMTLRAIATLSINKDGVANAGMDVYSRGKTTYMRNIPGVIRTEQNTVSQPGP